MVAAQALIRRLRVARAPRRPIHPGHFLQTRFLDPAGLSQDALARRLGISRRRVNELVRGRRGITPDTALRLALCFGMDTGFWLHLQAAWDVYVTLRAHTGRAAEPDMR